MKGMTYKDKSTIIEYIINLAYLKQWMVRENSSNLSQHLDSVLLRLSPEKREIIINDFIERKDKLWYLEFYSRSTYYRLKNEAMTSFLNCLGL